MKRLGFLALITLGLWVVAAVPARLLVDAAPLLVSLAAALICLIPASLTLFLTDRMRKRTPEEKIVATLAAPFVRMLLVGVGVAWAYFDVPLIHDNGFAFVTWVIVFYLVTLAVETRLLYIDTTASATAEPSNR